MAPNLKASRNFEEQLLHAALSRSGRAAAAEPSSSRDGSRAPPWASPGCAGAAATPTPESVKIRTCVEEGVREAQKRLYAGGKQSVCGLCHTLQDPPPGSQLPTVARSEIPVRWFTHAKFEHQAHMRATTAKATAENKNPVRAVTARTCQCLRVHRPAMSSYPGSPRAKNVTRPLAG